MEGADRLAAAYQPDVLTVLFELRPQATCELVNVAVEGLDVELAGGERSEPPDCAVRVRDEAVL